MKESKNKDIIILAIESSCDETSCAIVKNGREVLSNVIYSQVDLHEEYGGVVPEIASRNHIKKISMIVDNALEEAKITIGDVDGVATTYGPGLVGALLVGMSFAKALSFSLGVPLIPVNHMEGHICANFIEHRELEPPLMALVVSGGHTHIVHMKDYDDYEVLGMTRDDASGEAFDKVARILGLGYPGGPAIDKAAKNGNPHAIKFKRTYLEEGTLDFSFSGIKSAVLNHVNSAKMKNQEINVEDISASFQKAVVDVLVDKTLEAAKRINVKNIVLAGGVAANTSLRNSLKEALESQGRKLYFPSFKLCTDNAAMIGCSGYYNMKNGEISNMKLNAVPNLKIGERSFPHRDCV